MFDSREAELSGKTTLGKLFTFMCFSHQAVETDSTRDARAPYRRLAVSAAVTSCDDYRDRGPAVISYHIIISYHIRNL